MTRSESKQALPGELGAVSALARMLGAQRPVLAPRLAAGEAARC